MTGPTAKPVLLCKYRSSRYIGPANAFYIIIPDFKLNNLEEIKSE